MARAMVGLRVNHVRLLMLSHAPDLVGIRFDRVGFGDLACLGRRAG